MGTKTRSDRSDRDRSRDRDRSSSKDYRDKDRGGSRYASGANASSRHRSRSRDNYRRRSRSPRVRQSFRGGRDRDRSRSRSRDRSFFTSFRGSNGSSYRESDRDRYNNRRRGGTRGRSRSRSRDRGDGFRGRKSEIDKEKLLAIAKKNAVRLLSSDNLMGMDHDRLIAIKSGGQNLRQLTDSPACKNTNIQEATLQLDPTAACVRQPNYPASTTMPAAGVHQHMHCSVPH